MERGIASHWLSPYPTPNTPFTSLSPFVLELSPRAMYTSWMPRPLSATISFARDGLVLQAQFPMVLFPFPAEKGPLPFYPQSLQGTPLGLSQVHISLPMPLLTKGILIPSAPGCMTLMTFPFHLK